MTLSGGLNNIINYSRLKTIFRKRHRELGIMAGLIVLSSGFTLMLPIWAKHLIGTVLPKKDISLLAVNIALGMLLVLCLQLAKFGRDFRKYKLTNRVCASIRRQIFEKMMKLPFLLMGDQKRGDLISRISNDTQVFREGMISGLFVMVPNLVTIIGLLVVMLWHSIHLSLILLVILPLIALSIRHFSAKIRKGAKIAQETLSLLNSLVEESACGFKEIKSFVNERQVEKRFDSVNTHVMDAFNFQDRLVALGPVTTNLLAFAGIVFLVFSSAWVVFRGMLTIGDLTAFLTCLLLLINPIEHLANSFGFISRMEAVLDRFQDMMEMTEEKESINRYDDICIKSGRITFDHVDYTYPQGFCLNDIHFTVDPGETVAIVGPSGEGKTTLINLVPRFLTPRQGVIRIDGTDIAKCNVDSLRKQIGFMFQEPILFDTTLEENLLLAKPDASSSEMLAAARAAHVDEFASKLANGYKTQVGRYASHLSVGQRQRISIARALLSDPKILILDEPTSALDSESEELIHQALTTLCKNRTTLIVAHQLSTIRHADRIIVIDKGRIAEQGTHAELIAANGLYTKLYSCGAAN